VLGEYSRERGVLGLPEAIHRMTGLPASWFRLHNRGQIRTGAFADITVFNPSTVADTGTYGNPTTPPDGFTGTWVNGCRVSLDTTPTDGRPGRVLTLT
jgi:N-acyl-D-aspartate/D-glutamate deacylase